MFAWMLVSKPCSEATDIGWLLSLGADFGNKNKKVNIGKGRDWGVDFGGGDRRGLFPSPKPQRTERFISFECYPKTC